MLRCPTSSIAVITLLHGNSAFVGMNASDNFLIRQTIKPRQSTLKNPPGGHLCVFDNHSGRSLKTSVDDVMI